MNEQMPAWAHLMYSTDPNIFEVDRLYDEYYKTHKFIKDNHIRNHKKWRRDIESFINDKGYIRAPSILQEKVFAKKISAKNQRNNKNTTLWKSIGPFETYRNGTTIPISLQAHINALDRSTSDPNFLMAASATGGLFRSTDAGINWELTTASMPFAGTETIEIHPSTTDTIWASANKRLYQSTDSGTSWTERFYTASNAYEIKYDPNHPQIIYAVGPFGTYRTEDSGFNWAHIFTNTCWDLDFKPGSSDTIYLLKHEPDSVRQIFLRSLDAGISWDTISQGWYTPEDMQNANVNGGKIGVTPAAPEWVYVGLIGNSKADDRGWIGVYKSTDGGSSFTLPQVQRGGPYDNYGDPNGIWSVSSYGSGYHQGFYNYDLEVSHTDPNKLWVGTVLLSESTDGGAHWCQINGGTCKRITQHADVQDIEVYGNEIWTASDGGIDYSPDEYATNESRKRGIIGSDFWGFDTGWNTDILVGGKYHNGNTAYYQSYPIGEVHHVGGVEEATGYVHKQRDRKAYFNQYWSNNKMNTMLIPRNLGVSKESQPWATIIPNEKAGTGESSGYVFHPIYSDRIFIGKDSTLLRSDDGGITWNQLSSFNFGNGYVSEIEISRSNPQVMYVGYKSNNTTWINQDMYKTDDGGISWTKLTSLPLSTYWEARGIVISINPWDEDDLYIALRWGRNGRKVFHSIDGGITWVNITPSIFDGEHILDIYYQVGVDSSSVYAVTLNSMYRYSSSNNTWIDYSSGLPAICRGMRLRPFFKDNKIRMATYGRGIWEAPFAGDFSIQALPMTFSDTISCSRDTVYLDSHSIINQDGVVWLWEISPAPTYISNNSIRNPKILLEDGLSYDVTLTITDSNGNMHTNTIVDMIHVQSNCEIEDVSGYALKMSSSNQYAEANGISNIDKNFTVTMWIKPDSDHPNTAFMWSNGGDGNRVGVNFTGPSNDLRIHYGGTSIWAEHTSLQAPYNEWTHLALTADSVSGELVLYTNGIPYKYNRTIKSHDFSSFLIGAQKGRTSRWFKGEIDEVCLYNRALTQDEIRLRRHLTQPPSGDNSLIAYWQFNESSGSVQDRVGTAHAVTNGHRIISTTPVASGVSELKSINNSGNFIYNDTSLILTFLPEDHPDGTLVVSRLNSLPYGTISNSENLSSYWIINNYGSEVDSVIIKMNDPLSDPTLISPRLYNRLDNSYLENWTPLNIGFSEGPSDHDNYIFKTPLSSFGQFFIAQGCDPLTNKTMYYRDWDKDGYGDPMTSREDCLHPTGFVTNNQDCDDADDAAHPNTIEICDGIDNDCNGIVDDGDICNPVPPCEEYLSLMKPYLQDHSEVYFQAQKGITTNDSLGGDRHYEFKANDEIIFLPNFVIDHATQLSVEMDGCQ